MATEELEETKTVVEKKISTRQRNLADWKIRINWVGAGLLGLIGVLAATGGDSSSGIWPPVYRALTITFILISGGLLAYARANIEWAASRIEHKLQADPKLKKADELDRLPDALQEWPKRAEQAFSAALLLIMLSALTFAVSVWCSTAWLEC